MLKNIPFLLLVCLALGSLCMGSCSNTKYLAENQSLYIGSKIKVEDSTMKKKQKKNLKDEIEDVIRPKPNSSFLGLRFKLYVYNLAGEPKKNKGIRHFLRTKVGEPPVLGSDLNINSNTKIIDNYLENQGYLHAYSTGEKITKNKRTKAHFDVIPGPQSTIKSVEFFGYEDLALSQAIANAKENSFLKPGDPYNLEIIKKERSRISDNLKLIGYYYFNPDYLLIIADTGIGNNQVDLTVKLKINEMPLDAFYPYTINNVVIFPNYRLENTPKRRKKKDLESNQLKEGKGISSDSLAKPGRFFQPADTINYEGFKIVEKKQQFKPKVFKQAMQLKPGQLYNKNDQNRALNRLVTLGTFKFVKNEFTRVGEDIGEDLLDVTYLLTPAPKKSLNFELGGFSQDDSRLGSRISISWKNRNFLKGAELFTVKPTAGLEVQYGGIKRRPNTYNLGLETSLNIPRFIVPFFKIKPSGMFIPRTLVKLNYNYTAKSNYYKITSYSLGLGYNWKEDIMKDHKLFPINITYVHTDTLNKDSILDINLSNLLFNGLIIGPTYEYTFNTQLGAQRKNNFYFFGAADLAGNVLGLAQGTSLEKQPKEILGTAYAQYLKFQTDFRYYHNLSAKNVLAVRLFLGYGYAYGNSYQLPNIKQFYSGGSSSLRGFASRLVGPGTFNESFDQNNNTFVEMLGDIKGEFNLEYRFGIYRFINAAIFSDAGNIWLLRENSNFPGGKFTNQFYKELAVDAGFGLRFDFSILILRLDLGFPIRKPWYGEGNRWRLNDIHLGDPSWRKENLLLNLAIGYPF